MPAGHGVRAIGDAEKASLAQKRSKGRRSALIVVRERRPPSLRRTRWRRHEAHAAAREGEKRAWAAQGDERPATTRPRAHG